MDHLKKEHIFAKKMDERVNGLMDVKAGLSFDLLSEQLILLRSQR